MPAGMVEVPKGARGVRQPQGYTIWTVGDHRALLRDSFHQFLRAPWPVAIALIVAGFVLINLMFASVFVAIGGVEGAHAGSYWDAFVFSVQTIGTIGYGVMSPRSDAANTVMIIESVTGIVVIAIVTGLVFTKFARATARVAFSTHAVITQHDGVPTLIFRIGNRRANAIVDARVDVTATLATVTAEGEHFYKMIDLELVRDHMSTMRRGWSVMHAIDDDSPLHGKDAAALEKVEFELVVSVIGIDDVLMQTVHASHVYTDKEVAFGHRFVDTLTLLPNGDMLIDLGNFDAIVPDDRPRVSVPA